MSKHFLVGDHLYPLPKRRKLNPLPKKSLKQRKIDAIHDSTNFSEDVCLIILEYSNINKKDLKKCEIDGCFLIGINNVDIIENDGTGMSTTICRYCYDFFTENDEYGECGSCGTFDSIENLYRHIFLFPIRK